MRTAVLRGLRPTALTHRRRHPTGKWSDLDYVLLEAFQSYEDERQGKTGLPLWLTRADGAEVMFEVEEGIDFAEAALMDYDKAAKGPKGDKEPPAGAFRYVVPRSLNGGPAPEGGIERERLLRLAQEQQTSGRTVLPGSDLQIERRKPPGGYDPTQYG